MPRKPYLIKSTGVKLSAELSPRSKAPPRAQARFQQAVESNGAAKVVLKVRWRDLGQQCAKGDSTGVGLESAVRDVFVGEGLAEEGWSFVQGDVKRRAADSLILQLGRILSCG